MIMDMSPQILISREVSSMSSSWTEHLCISRAGNKWTLGEYGYNWAASIDEIPEDERYNEEGDINVPDEWDGHKVLGIADGEYIETDELVSNGNEIDFDSDAIDLAIEFAIDFDWHKSKDFYQVMKRLRIIVAQNLSQRTEFIQLFTEGKKDEDFDLMLRANNSKTLREFYGKSFDAMDESQRFSEILDKGIHEISDLFLTKNAEIFVYKNLEEFTILEFLQNFNNLLRSPEINQQIKDELIYAYECCKVQKI